MTDRKFVTPKTIAGLAKQPGRHPVKDKAGLFLTVKPTGLAYWTYRFRFDGRESELSLGAYADQFGLKQAIGAHAIKSAMVANGQDPRGTRRSRHPRAVATPSSGMTFAEAAEAYIADHEDEWRSAKHRHQWRASIGALPETFLALRADKIAVADVLDALKPMWKKTPTSAKRTRGRIESVLESARQHDDERPNPAAWSGWLKTQLGAPRVARDPVTGGRVNYASMPFRQIPALMARLAELPYPVTRALEFLVLTGARAGEVLGATWDEIDMAHDFDGHGTATAPMWVLPAWRMKAYRRHRVPLAPAAIQILERQATERGVTIAELVAAAKEPDSKLFIFPGVKPRQPNAPGMLAVTLKRAGGAGTVHGLRSAFRLWCTSMGAPFEIAEDAIAHAVANTTVQSYFRPDSPGLRIGLSNDWAKYCMSSPALPMLPAPGEIAA
jgi:integrase